MPLGWTDLAGRSVGIWGLGVEGRAALRRLAADGAEPTVIVDRDLPDDLGAPDGGAPRLAEQPDGLEALAACDVVIASPGISRHGAGVRRLEAEGVPVVGGLGLWMAETDPDRVIAVTGTKGKSTTALVLGHLLAGLGDRVEVGGNVGRCPFDPDEAGTDTRWVIEVSSYQATSIDAGPGTVVVTSLAPDHLPWHGGRIETYYADKLALATRPRVARVIANGDSELLRSRPELADATFVGLGDETDADAGWLDALGLLGEHNRRNALLARSAVHVVMGSVDPSALAAAAAGFEPPEARLTPVARTGEVVFVDDGLSTNVLPALAAVESFPDRAVALIVGGQDRGVDYEPLGLGLADRDDVLVVVVASETGPRMAAACARAGVPHRRVADLVEAVAVGAEHVGRRGAVVLSPAAPSFDRYRDYRHRSEVFAAAVVAHTGG